MHPEIEIELGTVIDRFAANVKKAVLLALPFSITVRVSKSSYGIIAVIKLATHSTNALHQLDINQRLQTLGYQT